MGLIGLILWMVAATYKNENRKKAKAWMNSALGFYVVSVLVSFFQFIMPTTSSSFSFSPGNIGSLVGQFIAAFVILPLMIRYRLKLDSDPMKAPKKPKHKKNKRVAVINTSSEINYSSLADEIFDVSLELTNLAGGQLATEGANRYSMSTINTATMYGTGLYEYSALLLRERMKKIYTNKTEFEAEDNKMIEIFANRIQIPVPAFLKIIDRSGGVKKWEQELKKEDKLPIKEYMDEVKVLVNRATRGLMTEQSPSESDEPEQSSGSSDEDDESFDDGL